MIIDKQFMQEQFPHFNLENKVDLGDEECSPWAVVDPE